MAQPKIDHFEVVPGHPDSITTATLDGIGCYAFKLQSGWVQDWDKGEGNRGGNGQFNERAEISYAPAPDTQKANSPVNVREGMLQTYDVDYLFAPGFPAHVAARHEWAVLTQFHVQPGHNGAPGFGGATVHDGAITFDSPNGDGSYFASVPIKTGVWFRIRMAVKWSAGKDGYAKIVDRATGKLVGRYDGPTIAPGEWKYLKQGYYRAGGLPEATVYQSSPGGPLVDITDGDLTDVAPVQPPAPPSPSKPSVDPEAAAALLMASIEQLNEIIAGAAKVRDDAQALLDKGPYKPAG